MDRSSVQTLNPFRGLCPEVDKIEKFVERWEERQMVRDALNRKDCGQYGLPFSWRVYAVRNTKRNIYQLAAYYRGTFAVELIDIMPTHKGFGLRLSETSSRKQGQYNSRPEAIAAARAWLIKNPAYAIKLANNFLKDLP